MVTMGRNRALIVTGALLLAGGAAVAWFLNDDGVRPGVGPFAADMTRCRERVFQDLRYPDPIEYIEDSLWHTGDAAHFTIGGLVRLRGGNGLPFTHSYQCEAEGGRILRVEVR